MLFGIIRFETYCSCGLLPFQICTCSWRVFHAHIASEILVCTSNSSTILQVVVLPMFLEIFTMPILPCYYLVQTSTRSTILESTCINFDRKCVQLRYFPTVYLNVISPCSYILEAIYLNFGKMCLFTRGVLMIYLDYIKPLSLYWKMNLKITVDPFW